MKECTRLDETKISCMPIGKFFKITIGKVIIDLIMVIVLIFLFIYTVPWAKNMYMQLNLSGKIITLLINFIIYGVILYPAACFLIIYFKRRESREKK